MATSQPQYRMITLSLLYLLYKLAGCIHNIEHRYALAILNLFFIITYVCFELYFDLLEASNYVIKTSQEIAESDKYSIGE